MLRFTYLKEATFSLIESPAIIYLLKSEQFLALK